jgi:hypothetical protein
MIWIGVERSSCLSRSETGMHPLSEDLRSILLAAKSRFSSFKIDAQNCSQLVSHAFVKEGSGQPQITNPRLYLLSELLLLYGVAPSGQWLITSLLSLYRAWALRQASIECRCDSKESKSF